MFTPWGYPTILKTGLIAILLSGFTAFFAMPFLPAALLLSLTLLLFTLYFFRDPRRNPPDEKSTIVAPADGKILLVQPSVNSFTGPSSTLVSIFMSPLNVHVNRIPLDGTVTHLRYHPGTFMMAFDHRSLESNEKMEIGIENGEMKVLFSQVSGFMARRIVCLLDQGDRVVQGNRFGMIRFGSRVDIVLPEQAVVTVRAGERTRAGETVIARF
ncbi:MAG: phosphatidylserine decarboxylase [Chlorobium sp.]|uniref:phosphatidylserine decarboxylase n=1 Tax=Chlorobium sp. TaxID=1095 RepID=UPI0025C48C51|nr:phosphatidylserine decarboxylase [Chlorobium sp.]MCF8383101.1 phosphatidylserine decarboxylase [Chlorobium sp.]